MTTPLQDQDFEAYVPVFDAIPDNWDDAKVMLVEQLKKISNGINAREIGFYLDQELLSGKAFIPGQGNTGGSNQYRSILRVVVTYPGLTPGANSQPHNVLVDQNFSLMQLYAAATDAAAGVGNPIPNGTDTITYDGTNIIITVSKAYTRAWAVMEYIQEL